MKTFYLIFFSFGLSVWAAASVKTPQTALLLNVRRMLEMYRLEHGGTLPKDWQQFIDSGIFVGPILSDSRRLLDIENRYIFVGLKPMQFENEPERVLIMARQAGGEGDNNDEGDLEKKKGRWLFVETSDGSIQTRRYPEVMLKFWFERAGLNFADFTSAAPRDHKPGSGYSGNSIGAIGSSSWGIWMVGGVVTFGALALAWGSARRTG